MECGQERRRGTGREREGLLCLQRRRYSGSPRKAPRDPMLTIAPEAPLWMRGVANAQARFAAADEVDGHHLPEGRAPLLVRGLADDMTVRGGRCDCGVADEHIERPELVHGRRDDPERPVGLADVAGHQSVPVAWQRATCLLRAGSVGAVVRGDPIAGLGEALGHRGTDPPDAPWQNGPRLCAGEQVGALRMPSNQSPTYQHIGTTRRSVVASTSFTANSTTSPARPCPRYAGGVKVRWNEIDVPMMA